VVEGFEGGLEVSGLEGKFLWRTLFGILGTGERLVCGRIDGWEMKLLKINSQGFSLSLLAEKLS